jgi:hypothetical protein
MIPPIRAGRLFGLVAEPASTVGSVCTIVSLLSDLR